MIQSPSRFRGTLPPNSYERREWIWVPTPGDRCKDGELQIFQSKAKGDTGGWQCTDYAVKELDRVGPPEPGRVFCVVNLDDESGEGVYETFLADRAGVDAAGEAVYPFDRCSCPAGRHGRRCKHAASLRAVLTKGVYHGGE